MSFFLKISSWFIKMLRSEAEVIKKFFFFSLLSLKQGQTH